MACCALLLTAALLGPGGAWALVAQPPRPHIVFIVVDDMGYHNIRAPPLHVNSEISSPTLARGPLRLRFRRAMKYARRANEIRDDSFQKSYQITRRHRSSDLIIAHHTAVLVYRVADTINVMNRARSPTQATSNIINNSCRIQQRTLVA